MVELVARPMDCGGLLNTLYDMIAMGFEKAGLPVVMREQLRRDDSVDPMWRNHPELHDTGIISIPLRDRETKELTTVRRFHLLVTPKDENLVTQHVQFEVDVGHLMRLNESQLAVVMAVKVGEVTEALREVFAAQSRPGGIIVEQGMTPRSGRA